jgi:hypothetical protein
MHVLPAVGLKNYRENEVSLGYIVTSCVKKNRTKISNICYTKSKQTNNVKEEKPHL